MSGIISILNINGEPISTSLLQATINLLKIRGVDAQNVWKKNNISLGHTLLKTTFEQRNEQQPLSFENRVWITADARLDGRKKLLELLNKKGRSVQENAPDVELILHSYHIWNTACLDHLMGDFVFIIWDENQQRLFAARDHFGILPFYYAQINNTLICSNTLNCIRLHPNISKKLNQKAVGDYLLWGMNMEYSTTIWSEIQRLPPAHTLTWVNGKLKVQRYWQLPRCLPLIRYQNPQEYVEHFADLLAQAVADRLRTERISTHLSGGMDSTSIAAIAQKVLLERGTSFDFQAFTMRGSASAEGSRQNMLQENDYTAIVAKHLEIPLNIIEADNYFRSIPPQHPQTPLPEPSLTIPARDPFSELTTRCAAHGRVILTGFGGDPGLRFGQLYSWEWLKHGFINQWLNLQQYYLSVYGRPRFYFRKGWQDRQKIRSQQPQFPNWFNPDFSQQLKLQQRWQKINAKSLDKISRYGMVNSPFWSNLFAWADPGYSGIPVKHYFPFFDLRLVNYLIAIPPVPWLIGKKILREAMQEKLPESVRTRPKQVFNAPDNYTQVMSEMVDAWIRDLLQSTENLSEYLNTSLLLEFLKSSQEISSGNRILIERNLSFAYWLRSIQ
ncbi:MAG: asparagine synthase-related protein [Oscillatoria sp. PMC 1068.18]|nr:asparagine synthase-related protein [Oscillatoria sp. PMC 1076.18]MEC4991791.1 asparagine synthase-related protein [Oscillatoria sp. PMC 1068.18]